MYSEPLATGPQAHAWEAVTSLLTTRSYSFRLRAMATSAAAQAYGIAPSAVHVRVSEVMDDITHDVLIAAIGKVADVLGNDGAYMHSVMVAGPACNYCDHESCADVRATLSNVDGITSVDVPVMVRCGTCKRCAAKRGACTNASLTWQHLTLRHVMYSVARSVVARWFKFDATCASTWSSYAVAEGYADAPRALERADVAPARFGRTERALERVTEEEARKLSAQVAARTDSNTRRVLDTVADVVLSDGGKLTSGTGMSVEFGNVLAGAYGYERSERGRRSALERVRKDALQEALAERYSD